MIENKFGDFFRGPVGILLIVGVVFLAAVLVLFLASRTFQGLLDPRQYVWE
jgi:hypothetical protein